MVWTTDFDKESGQVDIQKYSDNTIYYYFWVYYQHHLSLLAFNI